MSDTRREQFLAGHRPDDVLIYLHEEGVNNIDALADHGQRTEEGVVLVLPGEQGRQAFQQATSLDPMNFAGMAMKNEGTIHRDCTGGECPEGSGPDHYVKFVFAFAEEGQEQAGGIYEEGTVVHAYAACACGTTYSEKWVAGEKSA